MKRQKRRRRKQARRALDRDIYRLRLAAMAKTMSSVMKGISAMANVGDTDPAHYAKYIESIRAVRWEFSQIKPPQGMTKVHSRFRAAMTAHGKAARYLERGLWMRAGQQIAKGQTYGNQATELLNSMNRGNTNA